MSSAPVVISKVLYFIAISLNIFTAVLGQFSACSYRDTLKAGLSYSISSSLYPNRYSANTNCRWEIIAPTGYTIAISCPEVDIPFSTNCRDDKLRISPKGLMDLSDSQIYCGAGKINTESSGNRLVVALQSLKTSKGGRFKCSLITKKKVAETCQCGKRKVAKIVGGTETIINEFPMMAGLVNVKQSTVYCGATIIAVVYALSAAHCLRGKRNADIALLVGDHDTTTGVDTPYAALYGISKIIVHSAYNTKTSANDIGIVRTSSSIVYNLGVGPACLPFKFSNTVFAGKRLEAVGWGTTEFGGPISKRLRKVKLDVITLKLCQSLMTNIGQSQICTFTSQKDSCQNDSGGPLFYQDPSNGLIYNVGIISYGNGCASNSPGISINVTSYLNWITSNTKDVGYCFT